MKQSDWQRAFGQPDQAFHRAFTETLEQLEEMNMKRRYRISTLLAAAVLLTLAFAGAALATGGFGIFDRADVPPLKGAEALVETGLGRTANDLVRLTVEEAVRDEGEITALIRLTPLDPERYALFNDTLEDAPDGVYDIEKTVDADGYETWTVKGRADGKTVIDYWPSFDMEGKTSGASLDAVSQPDGSVLIRATIEPEDDVTDDTVFYALATLTVNGEQTRLEAVRFTLAQKEETRSASYVPVDNGEVERVKVYGVKLESTSVSAIAHVSYAYLPKKTDMGVSFRYMNGSGILYEVGGGGGEALPDGEYEIPQGYEGMMHSDRLQAMAEFPDELILEAKVIGEDTILGRVTLKRVDE